MQQSITQPARETPTADHATTSRLRTVTGNRFPRPCACGCGQPIPRDPEVRYVVDFGAPRPYPAFLREHSPDYGGVFNRAKSRPASAEDGLPGFVRASDLPREESRFAPADPPREDRAHAEDGGETSASPEAGRAWASGQLVFNAGSFESARSGFADYARDGETAAQLRSRVNRVILEDLEQRVIALHALHEKLRARLEGASFGDVVGKGAPR